MGLRCRQGDLTIAIKTQHGEHVGAIVRCVRFVGAAKLTGIAERVPDCWVIEFNGRTTSPQGLPWMMPDAYLRPIRDQPGEDETLTWAGLPKPIAQPTPAKEVA